MWICFMTMCSVLFYTWEERRDKIYNSTVLIKIFSFSQFGYWLFLWEKSLETLNLKNRIEMFFHHWDTETAYSSLVYNEVFLDFNVFLINVWRISLLFFNLSYYIWLENSLLPWSFSELYCVSSQWKIVNKHLHGTARLFSQKKMKPFWRKTIFFNLEGESSCSTVLLESLYVYMLTSAEGFHKRS